MPKTVSLRGFRDHSMVNSGESWKKVSKCPLNKEIAGIQSGPSDYRDEFLATGEGFLPNVHGGGDSTADLFRESGGRCLG